MLSSENVPFWTEVEHDLYEENGHIFGVELDLFNNHKYYYCKMIEDGREYSVYLDGDVYTAIEQFNGMISWGGIND